jgi:hypothetical protein
MGMVTMLLGIAKISYGCGPIQPDRNVVREALDLEENGPDEGDIYEFMGKSYRPFGDPFQETMIAALKEVSTATAERYQAMLKGSENDDTFLDEEEPSVRLD